MTLQMAWRAAFITIQIAVALALGRTVTAVNCLKKVRVFVLVSLISRRASEH